MNNVIQTISDGLNNSGLLGPCLDALVKSCMILALAGAGCIVWRRGSAAPPPESIPKTAAPGSWSLTSKNLRTPSDRCV